MSSSIGHFTSRDEEALDAPSLSTSSKSRNFPGTSAPACAFLPVPEKNVSSHIYHLETEEKGERYFLSLFLSFHSMKKTLTGINNFSGLPCAKIPKQTILSSCIALTLVSGVAGVFDWNTSSQEYFFFMPPLCIFFQLDILQMSIDMLDIFQQKNHLLLQLSWKPG